MMVANIIFLIIVTVILGFMIAMIVGELSHIGKMREENEQLKKFVIREDNDWSETVID